MHSARKSFQKVSWDSCECLLSLPPCPARVLNELNSDNNARRIRLIVKPRLQNSEPHVDAQSATNHFFATRWTLSSIHQSQTHLRLLYSSPWAHRRSLHFRIKASGGIVYPIVHRQSGGLQPGTGCVRAATHISLVLKPQLSVATLGNK